MSTARTFTAVKHQGQLVLTAPTAYKHHIASYGDGEELSITIKRKAKRQGSQLQRYYRGVVVADIAEACGISDPDEYESVHEALAWKFLKIADHPQFGTPRRRSTAKDDLSQAEMSDYVTRCIEWAEAEIVGCRVRRANEIEDWDGVPDYDWRAA